MRAARVKLMPLGACLPQVRSPSTGNEQAGPPRPRRVHLLQGNDMQLRCGPISPDALPLDHAAVEQPAHGALAAPVALAQTMSPRRPQMERVESPKQLPARTEKSPRSGRRQDPDTSSA